MKPVHFNSADFDAFEINNIPALFTNQRIDRTTIPLGYSAYDIRSGETTDFATIEHHVTVDHTGTVIVKRAIEFNGADFVEIDDYNFTGEEPSLNTL